MAPAPAWLRRKSTRRRKAACVGAAVAVVVLVMVNLRKGGHVERSAADVLRVGASAGGGRGGAAAHHPVLSVAQVSDAPRVYVLEGLARDEEIETLKRLATPFMKASTLALRTYDTEEDQEGVRTSQGAYVHASQDATGAIARLEQRVALLLGIPPNQGEDWSVLRYSEGQHYAHHYDFFHDLAPETIARSKSFTSQRLATLLIYFEIPASGGETAFPFVNSKDPPVYDFDDQTVQDFHDCIGVTKLKPTKRGDAILFYSLTPTYSLDLDTLHGGCTVDQGSEKWVATKWLHVEKYQNNWGWTATSPDIAENLHFTIQTNATHMDENTRQIRWGGL